LASSLEPNLILERVLQMASPNVMLVSPILETQQAFASALGERGIAPILASTVGEAQTILSRHPISLVFCSDELPGGGVDAFIRQSSRAPGRVPVVVVSRFDDWERYLNFLKIGAFDYVLYPPSGSEIERVVRNALSCVRPKRAMHVASAAYRRIMAGWAFTLVVRQSPYLSSVPVIETEASLEGAPDATSLRF
jgi:DNA-binding NtrC family response regulator